MAAFTAQDPSNHNAFVAKWAKILGDQGVTKKTILVGGQVAGNVLSFVAPWSGKPEVSYWLGREYWAKGVATKALSQFLWIVR
jgi:RimJ/RimL family protein N-acetyltransferase